MLICAYYVALYALGYAGNAFVLAGVTDTVIVYITLQALVITCCAVINTKWALIYRITSYNVCYTKLLRERETARAAAKVLGLNVAGVDLLQTKDGPKVLEVNSSPGLEGIEST